MSYHKNMIYVALIGDMVGSRSYRSGVREKVQERLRNALAAANVDGNRKADIEAGFVITTGDEFQALLKAGADPLWFARFLQDFMGEEPRFRFGIGKGSLATKDIPEEALGIDGPCFHNARDAIIRAKRDDATCCVEGFGNLNDIINVLMDNFYTQYWELTEKQRKIYDYHYLHGYEVSEIQKLVNYRAPAYVYKVLQKRAVKVARKTENTISEIFTTRAVK
jgi:hypothetical protein